MYLERFSHVVITLDFSTIISILEWYVTPKPMKPTPYIYRCERKSLAVQPTCRPLVIRNLILNYHNYTNTFFANFRNIRHYIYHCVRKLPTARFLSTNMQSKAHRTAIFLLFYVSVKFGLLH